MRHWTEETTKEAIIFFDTLSDKELRERLELCRIQQRMAFDQGKVETLEDLMAMENSIVDARMRKFDVR